MPTSPQQGGKFITEVKGHYPEFLTGYIADVKPGQTWLFPSKKAAVGHLVSIERQFRRVVEVAGLDPKEVIRHTLRHTAITHLVQAGVDLPTVQRISVVPLNFRDEPRAKWGTTFLGVCRT